MKGTSEEVGDISHVGAPDSTAVSSDQQLVDQVHSEGYGIHIMFSDFKISFRKRGQVL